MIKNIIVFLGIILSSLSGVAQSKKLADSAVYLQDIKTVMHSIFPDNRIINIVFHGHSVPSGYWADREVRTLESYPNLLLKELKKHYPYAVINIILTSLAGEHSINGARRFAVDALAHKPDVVIIDYALNDIGLPLQNVKSAWEEMIKLAIEKNTKVILLTPSPDQRINMLEKGNKLSLNAEQIRSLAMKYQVGLADPFVKFQQILREMGTTFSYMSHINHPNEAGHAIIANELIKWFK
ncbi:MAG: SGNH/GDSL hydrolase family protein [Pedobacter sp.]|nr:MAG: SGNH/GDSL hydrolase family protein [Pedobacter sp.]